jgi:hypothetical protein
MIGGALKGVESFRRPHGFHDTYYTGELGVLQGFVCLLEKS